MLVYYINYLLVIGLAYPLCIYKPGKAKKIAYLAITFGYMYLLFALRSNTGADFEQYRINLIHTTELAVNIPTFFELPFEPIFNVVTKLISMISTSLTFYFFVIGLVIFVPIPLFIYKYSKNVWLSTMIYVGMWFFGGSMSFVRQYMACSIILCGYGFLKQRKTIPFLLIVLLAGGFHKTALIMIPIYFLLGLKPNKKLLLFYGAITTLLYFTSGTILDFVTQYIFKPYHNSIYLIGLGFELMIIPGFIFLAFILLYNPIKDRLGEDHSTMLFNMGMFIFISSLFVTRHFVVDRFTAYLLIMTIVTIPEAIECMKCTPDVYKKRSEFKYKLKSSEKINIKAIQNKLQEVQVEIRTNEMYYYAAIALIAVLLLGYQLYGFYHNYHLVHPYYSVIPFLNQLPLNRVPLWYMNQPPLLTTQ